MDKLSTYSFTFRTTSMTWPFLWWYGNAGICSLVAWCHCR